MTVNGRILLCTACEKHVRVYEAVYAAATEREHEWIDPATYVCGTCLDGSGQAVDIGDRIAATEVA